MIWDIMGQKEYRLIHETAYQASRGAIVVCDLTRKETLGNLTAWITSLYNVTQMVPIILVGNKNDLTDQHQFGQSEIGAIGAAFQSPVYLTSAKTGEKVEEIFREIGKMIITKHDYEIK